MGGISYKKTLELVEGFMIDSHIRKYCSEICKGVCCENCYDKNPQACRHHEKRRLSCSIFVCGDMSCFLPGTDAKHLRCLNQAIKEQYLTYRKIKCAYDNIYFTKPDIAFIETVRFPKKIEKMIGDLNIANIKNMINELIKAKIKIHNAYEYWSRR